MHSIIINSLSLSILLATPVLSAPTAEDILQTTRERISKSEEERFLRHPPKNILETSQAGQARQYQNPSAETFLRRVAAASERASAAQIQIQLDPTDAEAHLDLASALKALERYQEAEAIYQKAIQLDPEQAKAYIELGSFLMGQRRRRSAIEVYQAMVKAMPDSAIAYIQLADSLKAASIDGQDRDDAIEAAYRKAISLDPESVDIYLKLGDHLSNIEKVFWGAESADKAQLSKAKVVLREAIRRSPQNVEAYRLLSFTTMLLDDSVEAAEAVYQEAFENLPDSLDLHHIFGAYLVTWRRQPERAEKFYRETIERGLSTELMYTVLANSLTEQNKYAEAEVAYREALQLSEEGLAYKALSRFLTDVLDRPDEAIVVLEEAIQQFPHEALFYNELGDRLQESGRTNEAIASYLTALPLEGSIESVIDLPKILLKQRRYSEVIRLYERFQFVLSGDLETIGQENLEVWQSALRGLGRTAEADSLSADILRDFSEYREAVYRKAIILSPDSGAFHSRLGESLTAQNKGEEAVIAYQNALQRGYEPSKTNFYLGQLLSEQSELDQAKEAYDSAIAIYESNAQIAFWDYGEVFRLYKQTGDLYLATDRLALALGFYQKALEQRPNANELAETVAQLQETINK